MRKALSAAVAALAAALLLTSTALAVDNVNTKKLRKGVTTDAILDHMRSFQGIADANGGNRAAATSGYEASADFVARRLRQAGYDVIRHEFPFARWEQLGPATLQREGQEPYTEGTDEAANDYIVSQFSGSGEVTGPLVTTNDIVLAPEGDPGSGTSGCEREDWPAGDNALSGQVALIERGTCAFVDKIALAEDLGAAAVLIFNDGYEDRTEPLFIGAPPFTSIPVAMTSYEVGSELYTARPVNVTFNVETFTEEVTQENVIADSEEGDPDRTIVIGAHLDSVPAGPGVNDNGSGSSALVEIAEEIAELKQDPRNRLRFAFWGAEESGLVGSSAYVSDLIDTGEIEGVEANLNFDMLSSPNFVRFVYDGDNSTGQGAVGPAGSDVIEQVFLRYFRFAGA